MIQSVVLASAAAGVLTAAAVIGITGLLIAVLLGVAANVFEVPVDEKAIAIRDVLPGANCGGCGYAGCDAMAAAIAAGEAPVNGCPVGGPAVADKIGEIMGVSAGEDVKKVEQPISREQPTSREQQSSLKKTISRLYRKKVRR